MNRVLSREQIRAFDQHAIQVLHIPGLLLMENAGRSAADLINERITDNSAKVVIVCGTGNNGGDGFVVARHLLSYGASPEIWLVGAQDRVVGDARINLQAWLALDGCVNEAISDEQVATLQKSLLAADFIVDALFGTGLDRALGPLHCLLIQTINRCEAYRIALDLPSGIDANTGSVFGAAVVAHETVTFAALKLGMLTPSGARHCGDIHVASLGVPNSLISHTGHSARLIVSTDVEAMLQPRDKATHKHAAGNVLAIAGSADKIGASLLVARGALRAGAGLATIGTFNPVADLLASRVTEEMIARIDPQNIEASLELVLAGRHAVAIGPGFGNETLARRVIEHVVMHWKGTKVVDADAISAFAGRSEQLALAEGQLILTPHSGEMGRLLGISSAEVEKDRFTAVRRAVQSTGATVVLKGAHSIVGFPDASLWINGAASPVLAVAGSGDVLSGIIAALACELPASLAAVAGVHIHAMAGLRWAKKNGADRGMLASEIADAVPSVIAELRAELAPSDNTCSSVISRT